MVNTPMMNIKKSLNLKPGEMLSPNKCAAILGVHRLTIMRAIHNGELESFKIGSVYRIQSEDFEKFLSDGKKLIKIQSEA